MDVMPEILNRRSVRSFTSQPVEKEQIERILEAARLAPSAKNRQEWRFVVIQKKETRQKIMEASFNQEYVGQAPAIIAVCTTNIDYRMPNGQLSYPIDLAFASAHVVLQAVHEGLGTCCITTFDEEEVRDLLTVPFSMRVILLILIGYSAGEPEQTPRKTLKQISSRDHW
ncbi:MAG TPA: nitroreductase family protein [Spirochaetia bacterium]|nr:nitroreductase family protein [Spirochaetia bacterium]